MTGTRTAGRAAAVRGGPQPRGNSGRYRHRRGSRCVTRFVLDYSLQRISEYIGSLRWRRVLRPTGERSL
jgi:hypothetical protein